MKTKIKMITAVMVAMAIANMATANADTQASGTLIYDNSAAIYTIHNAPNPIAARTIANAEIIYVNTGYGPAIYSYPGNVPHQSHDVVIEYVDQAYGPAIYSYPSYRVK
ncbi:MAG: hypothetical protein CTY16_06050 [Methylobacter sp.]|nr:MAG: hypothetical protein CTY16_06050 [Methylobacter sp.]